MTDTGTQTSPQRNRHVHGAQIHSKTPVNTPVHHWTLTSHPVVMIQMLQQSGQGHLWQYFLSDITAAILYTLVQSGWPRVTSVDLVELWSRVPALLEACTSGDGPVGPCDFMDDENPVAFGALRTLRLVNRQASRTALLGLKSYSLILCTRRSIDRMNTQVNAARLLQTANLKTLQICFDLTGKCSQLRELIGGFAGC